MPVSAFAFDVLQLLMLVEWQLDVTSFPGRGKYLVAWVGRQISWLVFRDDGELVGFGARGGAVVFWLFWVWIFL